LLRDCIQSELFCHLSRDEGEADPPVVPWVLLLALFEDWSDMGFPPVLRHFSCSSGPLKEDGEWLSNDIHHLPQHFRVHPVGAHGFVSVQIA